MRIQVHIKPKSSKNCVVPNEDGTYTVYVTKVPHEGQANKAMRELLSDYFQVGISRVVIISGEKSRKKTVDII